MKMEWLEVTKLVFGLAFVLTMPPFFCFGMVMHVICHYMMMPDMLKLEKQRSASVDVLRTYTDSGLISFNLC